MKTALYARMEKDIAAADSGGIRERWVWGLRVLNDPSAMSAAGAILRRGVADQLIAAAGTTKKGRNRLGEQEIQRRLRCARAYPKESQLRELLTEFDTWTDVVAAGFPPYAAPADEPDFDWRTVAEKRRDRQARAAREAEQEALFPLDLFEPTEVPLKELVDYTDELEEMAARFVARGRKRRAYLEALISAAGGDLSMTLQEAQDRLAATQVGDAS